MNLFEYADAIDKNLVFIRYSQQNGRISCMFENSEVKDNFESCVLSGSCGNADSERGAAIDYVSQISNRLLVFNAMSDKYRQEFKVPLLDIKGM